MWCVYILMLFITGCWSVMTLNGLWSLCMSLTYAIGIQRFELFIQHHSATSRFLKSGQQNSPPAGISSLMWSGEHQEHRSIPRLPSQLQLWFSSNQTPAVFHQYVPARLINHGPEGSGYASCDKQILVYAFFELRVEKIFTVHVKCVQGAASSCLLKVSNGRHLVKL